MGFICNIYASMHAVCTVQVHVEEFPKLLKWARVPQGCENMNPKPASISHRQVLVCFIVPKVCRMQMRAQIVVVFLLCCVQSVGERSIIHRPPKSEAHISLSQGKSLYHDHRHKDSHTSRIWGSQNTSAKARSHNIFLMLPI